VNLVRPVFEMCRRADAQMWPRAMTLCTVRRARLTCAVVTGVIVFANLHAFWTIHLIQGPSTDLPGSRLFQRDTTLHNAGQQRRQLTIHLIQYDDGPPSCVPLPEDWFMNETFNYIKFASYSAVPFFVVLFYFGSAAG